MEDDTGEASDQDALLGDASKRSVSTGMLDDGLGEDLLGKAVKRNTGLSAYPTSIWFIIVCEFCERFSYYGLRAVLVLYCVTYLNWDNDQATVMYHAFIMLCYLTPVLGATLGDSKFGKFKTILILSSVYCAGTMVVAGTAIPGVTGDPPQAWGVIIGLLLIAIGTGGIKPCVAAFGGDQIAENESYLIEGYFSMFYMSINCGSLLSSLITPKLRADVNCFGRFDCFPLAFGLPGILMFIAVAIFFLGKRHYKHRQATRNALADYARALYAGLKQKMTSCRGGLQAAHRHWLEPAEKIVGGQFVNDIKIANNVMYLFLPLPMFWALFDQSGSRWTLQATMMRTFDMGALGTFPPDMMQSLNAGLIVLLIPVFQRIIYPIFRRLGIPGKPLNRMALGMCLCGFSFIVAALLQLQIDDSRSIPLPTSSASQVKFVSGMTFSSPGSIFLIDVNNGSRTLNISTDLGYTLIPAGNWTADLTVTSKNGTEFSGTVPFSSENNEVSTAVIYEDMDSNLDLFVFNDDFDSQETEAERAWLKVVHVDPAIGPIKLTSGEDDDFDFTITPLNTSEGYLSVVSQDQKMTIESKDVDPFEFDVSFASGGMYIMTVLASEDGAGLDANVIQLVDGYQVSILWQVPQYVIMTSGEILFSITGLEFAYSQAPSSMKSILQAGWLMTVAVGSLVVIIVAESRIFENAANEFFFFAGLMYFVTGVFFIMSRRYKYKDAELSA
eukprot:m.190013 g.190013  ORF g.190013 m.190013 type:complete len:726 (+) comp15635_c0_seq3:18-2195(+)